ncbi:reverse transcriptase domain-containing protein, partial [Tanacetum coccineum]
LDLFKLAIVLQKAKQIQDFGPTSGIRATREIADKFSDEHLMALKSKFNNDVDFVNYIVGKVVPPNWTFEKRKRFLSQVKTYFWEEPYAFKLCADNIMRRCVAGSETLKILAHCHLGPTGRHHSASVIAKKLEKALQRYGVTHKLSMAYYPQSNGQTEVTNRAIKRILKRSVGYNPKGWSEKLNDALWPFRTAYKTPTWCTPFRLVYRKACHLPVEIKHKAHWALKQCNMDLTLTSESHLFQLNVFNILRK